MTKIEKCHAFASKLETNIENNIKIIEDKQTQTKFLTNYYKTK